MEIKAEAKYIHISPRKVRLLATLIKGMGVDQAKIQLEHNPKHSSVPLLKLLQSAIANATHNHSIQESSLVVSDILVNVGPVLKRTRARAFGRAAMIRKRMSHIAITLKQK